MALMPRLVLLALALAVAAPPFADATRPGRDLYGLATPAPELPPPAHVCTPGYDYAGFVTDGIYPAAPFAATLAANSPATIKGPSDHALVYTNVGYRDGAHHVTAWLQVGIARGGIGNATASIADTGSLQLYAEASTASGSYSVRSLGAVAAGTSHRVAYTVSGSAATATVDGLTITADLGVAINDASVAAELYTADGTCASYDWTVSGISTGLPTLRKGTLPASTTPTGFAASLP
jgi:hypothetical protein